MSKTQCPNEFGTYKGNVYLDFPEHMLLVNGGFYHTKVGCLVDICIADEIKDLWNKGISTYASCCGHGLIASSVIVDRKDVNVMKSLGYVRNESRNDICEFFLKSKHKGGNENQTTLYRRHTHSRNESEKQERRI